MARGYGSDRDPGASGSRLSDRIRGRVVYFLCRIGNNLNQLARIANGTGQIRYTRRLEQVLEEILPVIIE